VVNHWEGNGTFNAGEHLNPEFAGSSHSAASTFTIENQGYATTVTFFTNVAFRSFAVRFIVSIMIDGKQIAEKAIFVHHVASAGRAPNDGGN